MSGGVPGKGEDFHSAKEIQSITCMIPMINLWELVVEYLGSEVLEETADLVQTFVMMLSGDEIVVFFRGENPAAGKLLEAGDVQGVVKVTV